MSDLTPQQVGARITEVQGLLAALDTQAAKIVAAVIKGRNQLSDLAAQRQALVSEVDQMLRPMLSADWRDDLRASGDDTSP